jgi:hypothetical protein
MRISQQYLLAALMAILVTPPVTALSQNPSGNPFQDAPLLSGYVKSLASSPAAASKQIFLLATAYAGRSIKTKSDLTTLIAGNNFLTALNQVTDGSNPTQVETNALLQSFGPIFKTANNALTNATPEQVNLSANNIGGAIGSFIAERFKQEVEIAFLQKFQDWIKTETIIAALLPQTKVVLTTYDPYQYTTFLQALREAFSKDVSNFPPDLEKYLANPKADPTVLGNISNEPYYNPAVYMLKLVLEIRNLASVINEIDSWATSTDPLIVNMPSGIKEYMVGLSIISNTLTTAAADSSDRSTFQYITPAQIQTALNDKNITYFVGLFLLKYKTPLSSIQFLLKDKNRLTLYAIINGADQTKITSLSSWFTLESTCLTSVANSFSKIKSDIQSKNPVDPNDEYACIDSLTGSVQHILAFPFSDLGITIDSTLLVDARITTSLVQTAGDLYLDFQGKNYGLALTHIITLLDTAKIGNPNTMTLIQRYGSFAVSVVNAQSQDDVLSALETAALPVGSYQIKRNSVFSVELNAYAGVFGGLQVYSESNLPQGVRMTTWIGGFTAPVGLNFGWGCKGSDGKFAQYANSLFISLIDVGAITAFKLQSDATSTLPNFTWNNILAPGIYYVHGIKKSLLSYGLGAQYGPELRSINSTSATITPAAWSARFFLAADIPFFNFYSKSD